MALATQCPHCHTTFRVAHDQLKLRSGSVRCGACQQVFNGIEHLLRPDNTGAMPAASATMTPKPAPLAPRTPITDVSVRLTPLANAGLTKAVAPDGAAPLVPINTPPELATSHRASPPDASATPTTDTSKIAEDDPLQRMTLVDFSAIDDDEDVDETERVQEEPNVIDSTSVVALAPEIALKAEPIAVPSSSALHSHETKPVIPESHPQFDQALESNAEEPAFVIQGRRQQRSRGVLRALARIACFLLTTGLLLQGTYYLRDLISAWYPQSTEILVEACTLIGCEIKLPAQIEAISIESSDLQSVGGNDKNTFEFTVLLRNQSHIVQQWPFIELTLNDSNDKAILRRTFRPQDFSLSAQDLNKGIAANSEQAMKLSFELPDVRAFGFRVHSYFP